MALTVTNAAISIQDGTASAVNLTPNTSIGFFTPGNTVTFALQSTAGIVRAEYSLNCPKYPGLHQLSYVWNQGMANQWQVQMPAATLVTNAGSQAGIEVNIIVSDGGASIASAKNSIESSASTGTATAAFNNYADYVAVAALPAYTNVAGTLTGNANGAITSTMADGQTPAVGDTFLLPNGIAAAGADAGLYTITTVGSGSVPFVVTRAAGWATGTLVRPRTEILVAKGTVNGGASWVNTLVGLTNAVGTASFTFYPRFVAVFIAALTSGAATIASIPILSATGSKTTVVVERVVVGGTVTATVMYNAGALTAGPLGTASIPVAAQVAAGTTNAADTSAVTVSVFNQV